MLSRYVFSVKSVGSKSRALLWTGQNPQFVAEKNDPPANVKDSFCHNSQDYYIMDFRWGLTAWS